MFGSRLEVKKYEETILKYEARPVVEGKILFYGSSTFARCSAITKYTENPVLEEEVRMKDGSQAIVNHGFGGSSADDLLYYYDRMVRPYKPRAMVIFTGGNDAGFGYSAADSLNIIATMIDWFQADFPGAPVYCMTIVPQLKKVGEVSYTTRRRDEYNELLEDYCAEKEGVSVIRMQDAPCYFEKPEDQGDYNKVWEAVYHEDRGHLNAFGYSRFMDFIREFLDREGLL